jgi:hypothetical protein
MKRLNLTLCSLLIVIVAGVVAIDAQTPRVSAAIKQIPLNGATTTDFVPHGWELNNEATEDLDGDNIMDAAITLTLPTAEVEKLKEAGGDDYESAPSIIVVLFGKPNGGYRRFAVNGRLYPDNSDERSYLTSRISKGVLIVETNWGDGWASDITYRFRYDRVKGKLMLIGFDSERYDRTSIYDGQKSSENYVTGLRIDYAKSVSKKSSSYSETRRGKVKRAPVSFEDTHLVADPDHDGYKPF